MDENIKKLFEINPKDIPTSIPIFPLDNVLLLPCLLYTSDAADE